MKVISVARYLCGIFVAIVFAFIFGAVVEVSRPPSQEGFVGDGLAMIAFALLPLIILVPLSVVWTEMTIERKKPMPRRDGLDFVEGLVVFSVAFALFMFSPRSEMLAFRIAGWLASLGLLLYLLLPKPLRALHTNHPPMPDGLGM